MSQNHDATQKNSGLSQHKISKILSEMWADYCSLNPAAKKIYDLFTSEGEVVLNDHIALRTFNHPKLGIKKLAKTFEENGYVAKDEYFFKEKKLYAKHWEHEDANLPKIFISELELEKVSPFTQETINKLVESLNDRLIESDSFSYCGRPWEMSYSTYSKLAQESEYASWVAAFGFRPNHFTVNINALKKFQSIDDLNKFIQKNGYTLNNSGGLVKGSPEQLLEQSSTMAKEIEVSFTEGKYLIPGCYYEFAKRYKMPNGKLYQGFVATSADKIFESTNRIQN